MVTSRPNKDGTVSYRFIQSMKNDMFMLMKQVAAERDSSVQELIRAVIIPEWFKSRLSNTDSKTFTSLSGGSG